MGEEKIVFTVEMDDSVLKNHLIELGSIIKSEIGSAITAINEIKQALVGVGNQANKTTKNMQGLVRDFNDYPRTVSNIGAAIISWQAKKAILYAA